MVTLIIAIVVTGFVIGHAVARSLRSLGLPL